MRLGNKHKLFNATFSAIAVCSIIIASIFGYYNYSTSRVLEQTQENLKQQIDDLNNTNSNLQENNSELSSQLQTLQSQLLNNTESLQANLNSLKTNYTNLLGDFAASQNSLTALQTQQNTLQNKPQSVEPFNYLIYNSNGNYIAENGATLSIDYSGNNATKVCQSCIDSLTSRNGGKIILAGTLTLDGPLIIRQGQSNGSIEISGIGPAAQLIVSNKKDGIDLVGNQAFGYGGPYHAVIQDLVLTSGNPSSGKCMNDGICIRDWFDVNIQDVMIFYANDSGINIVDSASVKLENVYVEGSGGTEYGGANPLVGAGISLMSSKDCYFDACYSDTNMFGFLIEANPITNNIPRNIFLSQCEATSCEQVGVSIANADSVVFGDSLVEGSLGDGTLITDSFHLTIANTVIRGNQGNGLVVNSQSSNLDESLITIDNCIIDANGKNGIGIYSQNKMQVGDISIIGCQITDSGACVGAIPAQPYLWDGININTDAITGGNCTNIIVSSCFIGNSDGTNSTQEYGIRSLGNSDYIQVFQNNFFNNLAGDYTLVAHIIPYQTIFKAN